MKYQFASATDLAADEFFIQSVKSPTTESDLFWQSWQQEHPSRLGVVEEARELVTLLAADEHETQEADLETVWQRLQQDIREEPREGTEEGNVRPLHFWQSKGILAAAASIVLLLAAGFYLFSLLQPQTVAYATAFGEKRRILLPDSSVVVLNANSTVSYTDAWSASEPRVVKLEGEAYFAVTHQVNHQKFIVQTPDGTQVEVLGTEFDVVGRDKENRVVLASGKVRLSIPQGDAHQQLLMKPGDLVEVSGKTGEVTRKQVRTELYTSWKDNRIIFDNTSLREIATMLEQVYGFEVVIEDTALAEQEITASLDDWGVDSILGTVSETLGTTITRQDNTITIRLSNI